MPTDQIINKGSDGFYHPVNEEQIVALVNYARSNKLKIRCRGAAHSVAWAIYTDSRGIPNGVSEQNPPDGPNVNVMLDQYNRLTWIDEAKGIIEVETGIHLGYDPEDPTHTSTLANSLLFQAFEKGWALSDLGGITHQTVGGFLSTGSAGGSLAYDLGENLAAFRVVDGLGNVRWVEKETDTDLFNALGVSLGLLGIITKVRFQLTPNYYIYGQQITTPTTKADCPVDLFGPGTQTKPSMQKYLENTPYTRMLWWPQKGVERVVIWEAVRGTAIPVFDPIPFIEFADVPFLTQVEQMFASILFTLLGNPGVVMPWKKLGRDYTQFHSNLKKLWSKKMGAFLAGLLSWIVTAITYVVGFFLVVLLGTLRFILLWLYPKVIDILQPLTKKGKAQLFMDYMWRSLPMDNAADDILMGTEFTEMWIPIEHTERAMQLLDEHYRTKGTDGSGYYMTELYAGHESSFWMSPGHGGPRFRIDPFWYINNAGVPDAKNGFYGMLWELFRSNDIPFRLHWAKFLPDYEHTQWAEYFRAQYPRWDDFMALRAERDPDGIFFNDYWRLHLIGS